MSKAETVETHFARLRTLHLVFFSEKTELKKTTNSNREEAICAAEETFLKSIHVPDIQSPARTMSNHHSHTFMPHSTQYITQASITNASATHTHNIKHTNVYTAATTPTHYTTHTSMHNAATTPIQNITQHAQACTM